MIVPGEKFMDGTFGVSEFKQSVYDRVVHKTRKNLVPYNDIQRVMMVARGDVVKASDMINARKIPSNPEVMIDLYNRLCDLEELIVKCCEVLEAETGTNPNLI